MNLLTEEEIEYLNNILKKLVENEEKNCDTSIEDFDKWYSKLPFSFFLMNSLREKMNFAYNQGLADGQKIPTDISINELDKLIKEEEFIQQVKEWIQNPKSEKLPDNPYVEVIGCACKKINTCIAFPEYCEGNCNKINLMELIKDAK